MLFGASFVLVWAFIGSMIVGDRLHHTRTSRLDPGDNLPLPPHRR
jgi:hypothetical protein